MIYEDIIMSEPKHFPTDTINNLLADYAELSAIFAKMIGGRDLTAQEQQMMDIMLRMHERLTKAS